MKIKLFAAIFVLALFIINISVNAQVERKLKVVNKTGIALSSVRVATHDSFNWGLDLNIMASFPINGTIEFRQKIDTNLCSYDIKFADAGGKEYILPSIDFCKEASINIIMPEEKKEPEK
jgi:hypothetical protein